MENRNISIEHLCSLEWGDGDWIHCRENPSVTRSRARNAEKQQTAREAGNGGRKMEQEYSIQKPLAYGCLFSCFYTGKTLGIKDVACQIVPNLKRFCKRQPKGIWGSGLEL